MTFVRGMGGFYVRIQYVSTSCLRYGAPIQQLTSGCSVVLFRTKRFCSTKHVVEFIWFRTKSFCGTKLPEDCPLWPAAYEVERIAPAWRTSPHGPTGRRTWDPSFPYHMFDVYGFPGHGQTQETSQNKKHARSSAKPCPYKACRYLQRRFWYSHRDSNPNRQNRNLKSYPLDYGSKRGQEQMPSCGIDFPYLRCKVNYFND